MHAYLRRVLNKTEVLSFASFVTEKEGSKTKIDRKKKRKEEDALGETQRN